MLGLVHPIEFHIPSPSEILGTLKGRLYGKELLERSIFLREPSLIELYDSKDFVEDIFGEIKFFVSTLIREIFKEEGKKLTEIYEGILYANANGKRTSGEIASELYSSNLISKEYS